MNVFRHLSTLRARKAASHEIDPEDDFLGPIRFQEIDSQNLSSLNLDQMEGQLERPLGKHVFYISLAISVFIIVGFSYRLFAMQVINGDDYRSMADNNRLKKIPLFSLRGTISDRNGNLLAWNGLKEHATTTEKEENSKRPTNDIPKRVYVKTPGFSHLLGYVSYPKKDQKAIVAIKIHSMVKNIVKKP